MPEDKPAPNGLPYIHTQHGNGSRVTDKSYDHGGIDDGPQAIMEGIEEDPANDVGQKSGEKRTCAEGDQGEIEDDPQAKGEVVIHIRLVQAFPEDQEGRHQAPCNQDHP